MNMRKKFSPNETNISTYFHTCSYNIIVHQIMVRLQETKEDRYQCYHFCNGYNATPIAEDPSTIWKQMFITMFQHFQGSY